MDRVIKFGLIFLIIYCPLAFGAVHIFPFTLMEITVLVLWLCLLMKQVFKSRRWKGGGVPAAPDWESSGRRQGGADRRWVERIELSFRKSPLNFFALAFLGLLILQSLPLPATWVKTFSPETFGMYQSALGKVPDFVTLSICPYSFKIGLFKILAYMGAFWLIINWADNREKITALVFPFILIGSFEAIYGILMYLGKCDFILWYQNIWYGGFATGTYVNRNHLAGLLEITIPMSFGLLVAMAGKRKGYTQRSIAVGGIRGFLLNLNIEDHDQAKRILLMFLIAIMFLALLLSGSRGGILSLAVAFILMSVFLLFRSKVKRYALAGVAIVLIALGYGLLTGMSATLKRFEKLSDDAQIRVRFATTSLGIVRDFPLMGTGWGTFEKAYPKYQDPKDDKWVIDHAHHDWVELAAEMGLVGLGLGIFFLFFCLGYFFFLWKKRKNSLSVGIGLGGMGAITSLALHSLTDFNMHIPANALLLSIAVGVTQAALTYHHQSRGEEDPASDGEHSRERKNEEQKKLTFYLPVWLQWPLALFLMAGFCYALMLVREPYLAEKLVPTLPDSTIKRKKDPTIGEICKAITIEPTNAEYFYWLASLLEESAADDQQKIQKMQNTQKMQKTYEQPVVLAVLKKLKVDGANQGSKGNKRNKRSEDDEGSGSDNDDDDRRDNGEKHGSDDGRMYGGNDGIYELTVGEIAVRKDTAGEDTVKEAAIRDDTVEKAAIRDDAVGEDAVKEVAVRDEVVGEAAVKKAAVREPENDYALLALERAILLNPSNPYYHLKLAWHTLDQGKQEENMDHIGSFLAAAEKEFDRAVYFMPQSAQINFSVGCYWIWKSKVVEDENAYLDAFAQFIQYFKNAYRINSSYKKNIQQVVQQYYPIKEVLERIFSS
ncbi:MAG: O-antigen ligase family protein [bacterium]